MKKILATILVLPILLVVGCGKRSVDPAVKSALTAAESHLGAGKVAMGVRDLRLAVSKSKHKADVYILSIAMLQAADKTAAVDFSRELLDLSDKHKLDRVLREDELKSLLQNYGYLCIQLGRNEEGIRIFDRAVRMWPEDPIVLNTVGYSYADASINLKQALELTRKANELMPGNADCIDSLGWAYYRLGNNREALKYLQQAVKLSPGQGEIRLHLGTVYAALGQTDVARVELKKSSLLGGSDVAAKALELIKSLHDSRK